MASNPDIRTLKESVFFGSLPPELFDTLISRSRVISLTTGQTLFRQGDPAEAVFCVQNGLVKLSITQRDGTEAVIEVFHPGQSFAEALAFQSASYPASATALSDCRVLALPIGTLQSELQANPQAFSAILSATYKHLHKLVHQIERLKSNSGLERVAHFILASSEARTDSDAFDIPYEKQVLASLLGMKPETLSRTFKRLEFHGVIVSGRRIKVASRARLLKVLDMAD